MTTTTTTTTMKEWMKDTSSCKMRWHLVHVLVQQQPMLWVGIELGNVLLHSFAADKSLPLLTKQQFWDYGLWDLVQTLTVIISHVKDRSTQQCLWKLVLDLIHMSNLQARFQCISSVALHCPVSIVSSMMFTELKNQIWKHWDSHSETATLESSDTLESSSNPFASSDVVMVCVQQLGKVLPSQSQCHCHDDSKSDSSQHSHSHQHQQLPTDELHTVTQWLDPLNSCLNVIRFLLLKDKVSNRTSIYDDDCPLKEALANVQTYLKTLSNPPAKHDPSDSIQQFNDFQQNMIQTQLQLTLDLINRTIELFQAKPSPQ
ncbi:hypothetical protein RFI_25765 [Reticulomyxa filosa]|uniref:Uncharacterized protein n=1 Tax=Reticulomyxa filosa TaxID=46433 RepID=X6MDW1_RETFI|nr:hypothetical protein RFI_25765 [Reticulomyxa filosa]|eukprot:ETO11612.1 hypothetical protein RFI_25765 [Reticulomyxa filosa]